MFDRGSFAPLAAEAIGTYLFFVLGAGSIIVDIITGNSIGILGIALVHGLALAVLATAFGAISGALPAGAGTRRGWWGCCGTRR